MPADRVPSLAAGIADRLSRGSAGPVRPLAVLAVLLARRVVLRSSALTPAAARTGPTDLAASLLGRCCDDAARDGDLPLAQLMDWTCAAWTGAPHDGSFFAGRHLPEPLHAHLHEVLGRTSRPMLVAAAEQVLGLRLRQLQDSVDRHSAVDRGLCTVLLAEPVAAVVDGLRTERTDGGLLEHDADDLVKRANARQDRPIPANGRRWPQLVRAVADVRDQVRELLGIAALVDGAAGGAAGPPAVAPAEHLSPDLDLVLATAVLTDPDADAPLLDDGTPLLAALVDGVLAAVGPPGSRAGVQVATWAAAAGLDTAAVDAELVPVRLLAERADALLAALPDGEQGPAAGLRELVAESIRTGEVADLDTAVEMLESERDRRDLIRRAAGVERGLDDLDEPVRRTVRRYLRVARERLDAGDLGDAAEFVRDAETGAAPARPRRAPGPPEAAGPGPAAPPPAPVRAAPRPERDDHDEASAKRLYEAGQVDAAVLRLRRILADDPRSPGAYLLLRIHREQHQLPRAVEFVEQLAARGAVTWRHHVELCRNAIAAGDLGVARDQYRRAEQLDAGDAWLSPLLRGMRTLAPPQVVARPDPVAGPDDPIDDAVLRLRAGKLTQPAWRDIVADHVAAGRVDHALALTRQAAAAASWAPGLLFRVLQGAGDVDIDEQLAVELTELSRVAPHDQSMVALADLLLDADRPEQALAVADTAERIAAPPVLPRLWFVRRGALARLGRGDEADAVARRSRPPLPGQRPEPGVTAAPALPELHWPRLISNSTAPLIRAGQQHQADGETAAAADAWTDAVRAGYLAVLPSALAALVASDRAAQALDLYAEFADDLWVGAGAAWNIGCAYAATGRWHAAADSFAYHARVRSQPYDAAQEAALRPLFAAVGRPLPAIAPPPAPLPAAAGTPGSAPPGGAHDFSVTAAALRAAMRRSGRAESARQLARVEVLYEQLADPEPTATAEYVRTLVEGGRTDQGWRIVTEAITRTGAARALLPPALRIAREGGPERLTFLRNLLEGHGDGDDVEVLLHLAKIADLQDDGDARGHYATLAVRINPASAEVASLLAPPTSLSAGEVGPQELTAEIRGLGADRPEDVAASLDPTFGPGIEALRMSALKLLDADVDQSGAKYELPDEDLPLVDDALLAVQAGSWEEAARLFRECLARRPRHLGLAAATVTSLIRIGHLDAARTIAGTVAYAPMGREAQARVAFASRDYAAAAGYLEARERRRRLRYADVLGRAGLQLHFLDDPTAAVEVLLESSRHRLPGIANSHAALASVLAGRHGLAGLCAEAVRVMLAGALDSAAAVAWAIEHDNIEALHEQHAPRLRAADLTALVAHFDPHQRDRLRRFLQYKRNAPFLRQLAELDERDGRTTAAFESRWMLTTYGSHDQLTHLRELLRFCQRTGYADGFRRALGFKVDLGQPVTAEEERWLDGQVESAEYRERELGSDIRAFLWDIGRIDLGAGVAAVVEPVGGLVDRLTALTEGTTDQSGVRRLHAHWTGILDVLAAAHSTEGVEPDLAKASLAFRDVRAVQAAFGTRLVADAATEVSKRLYAEWERLAHHVHESDPLEVEVLSATRVAGGPVELLLRLDAGTRADGLTVELEAGSEITTVVLPRGAPREVPLVADTAADVVAVEVGHDGAFGRTTRRHDVPVVDHPEQDALVECHFRPNTPVRGRMFVGRDHERAELRMVYRGAAGGAVPLRFLEGPREVGKSSLALSLAVTGDDPDSWPVPGVLTVYLTGEGLDVSRKHLLHHIAMKAALRLDDLPAALRTGPVPTPVIADEDDFRLWWAQARRSSSRPLGLLVILDEVQDLLRSLNDAGTLRSVFGVLRAFQQEGLLALLLCGSCTLRTVDGWLAGTSMAGEVVPIRIGFLRRDETEEVVRRGFDAPVLVLAEAVDEVWRVTEGYPNHIHLIGDEVGRRLRAEGRRTVSAALVREVGYQLAGSQLPVKGIIKNDDDVLHAIDLLLDLRDPDDETAIDPTVRHRLTSDEREQLERYLALGLLRENSGRLEWSNELMRLWLAGQSHRHPSASRPLRVRDPAEAVLLDAGYTLVPTHRRGSTREVERQGRRFVARRFTVDGDPAGPDVVELLDERFARYALASAPPGVPEYCGQQGDWLLFDYVPGLSLRERLTHHPDVQIDPVRAARWIVNACDVLTRVDELWSVTHGDLRPGNVITTTDDEVAVVGWGHGALGAVGGRPSPLVPRSGDHCSPQYLARIAADEGGATPSDDVYALGTILFRFLHPDGTPPYPRPADRLDLRTARPAPLQADERLVGCVHTAVALDDAHRHRSPRAFATALRDAVPELRDLPADLPPEPPAGSVPAGPTYHIDHVGRLIQEGNSMTGKNSIHVEGSITDSVVGHHNKVRESLNRTQASSADDQVKNDLAELADQVEALRARIDPSEADALVRDFDAFSAEAASDHPRESSLARIGTDLIEDVSSVADAAGPLIALVQRIVEFFQA